jgi:hypothetical protein
MCAKFFFVAMKVEFDEGGRNRLLDDNTSSGAVTLQVVNFQYIGVQINHLFPVFLSGLFCYLEGARV